MRGVKATVQPTYASQVRGMFDDTGNSHTVSVSLDLEGHGEEVIDALRQLTQGASPVSQYRLRIASRVAKGDAGATLLDSLASTSPATRRAAAQACGLLRFDGAVLALGALLADPARPVRRAAAEALGRIGGQRAADHLIQALRSRSVSVTWLLLGLVRAAPDHYLEARLTGKPDARVLPWLALAAGIQRRKATRPRILDLTASGDLRTRANACRALSWIGEPADVPALRAVMHGEDHPRVREAAARSLRRFREPGAAAFLESIAPARRPRVAAAPTFRAETAPSTPQPAVPEYRPSPPPAPAPQWAAASTFSAESAPTMPPPAAPEYQTSPPQAPPPPYRPSPPPPQYRPSPPPAPYLTIVQGPPVPPPPPPAPPSAPPPPLRPPATRRPSIAALLGGAIHGLFEARPPDHAPRSLPPLTPVGVASTPHHYTPAPSLLDAADQMPEGA